MPTAGAVIPPVISPLRRKSQAGGSGNIDTGTYIELDTETPNCKIYFSSDGSKPNPFQLKVGGRESTFKYKGPFTLKAGKRTLKAIAVTRDGLKESNTVTKTFQVADTGPPSDDIDVYMDSLSNDSYEAPYRHTVSSRASKRPLTATNRAKSLKPKKQAWATSRSNDPSYTYDKSHKSEPYYSNGTNNSVQLPEGPINPTNYSGTQINFWGVPPANIPSWMNGAAGIYGDVPGQFGYMTNEMLHGLDQPRLSIQDLKRMIQDETERLTARPAAIEYVKQEPELKSTSPGSGDWKAQAEHIYAHLLELCKTDGAFRKRFGEPSLGKMIHADFDEEDDAYLLTISVCKAGHLPKPKPKPAPPPKVIEPPKPPPQKKQAPSMREVIKVVKPPPKKKKVPTENMR